MNTVEFLELAPIFFIMSKYYVTNTMSITSLGVVPGTLSEKAKTLSRKPSTIA
jgi:hypothetical protein